MTAIFKEVNAKIRKFDPKDQRVLAVHWIRSVVDKLKDPTPFDHKKLLLLMNILMYAKDESSKLKLIYCGLGHKIKSIRALVLDLIDIDFSREQNVFYKPDKWIDIIIRDFKKTFSVADLLEGTNYKDGLGIDKVKFSTGKDSTSSDAEETHTVSKDTSGENYDFIDCDSLSIKIDEFNEIFNVDDVQLVINLYNRRLCREFLNIFCSCDKFNSSGNQLVLNMIAYIDKMTFVKYDFSTFMQKLRSNFNEGKRIELEKLIESYKKFKADKKEKKKSPGNKSIEVKK